MATNTTNLGLIKPAGTDKVRIAQINQNMDILDEKIGPVGNTSVQDQIIANDSGMAIVSTGNTHSAIASGQYVYIRSHGTLAEGLYKANSAISANATLSTSNVTHISSGGMNDLKGQIDSLNSQIASQMVTTGVATAGTGITISLAQASKAGNIVTVRVLCTKTDGTAFSGRVSPIFQLQSPYVPKQPMNIVCATSETPSYFMTGYALAYINTAGTVVVDNPIAGQKEINFVATFVV